MNNEIDIFTYYENKFDRITYQSDLFFWILIALDLIVYLATYVGWIPLGSGGGILTVLMLFTISWIYTNARRRACGVIKAAAFALVALLHPFIGAVLYFLLRPKELVVLMLPPGNMSVWPIFSGPVWIFMRAPFRFLLKLSLWLMGLAFLVIGIMDVIKN